MDFKCSSHLTSLLIALSLLFLGCQVKEAGETSFERLTPEPLFNVNSVRMDDGSYAVKLSVYPPQSQSIFKEVMTDSVVKGQPVTWEVAEPIVLAETQSEFVDRDVQETRTYRYRVKGASFLKFDPRAVEVVVPYDVEITQEEAHMPPPESGAFSYGNIGKLGIDSKQLTFMNGEYRIFAQELLVRDGHSISLRDGGSPITDKIIGNLLSEKHRYEVALVFSALKARGHLKILLDNEKLPKHRSRFQLYVLNDKEFSLEVVEKGDGHADQIVTALLGGECFFWHRGKMRPVLPHAGFRKIARDNRIKIRHLSFCGEGALLEFTRVAGILSLSTFRDLRPLAEEISAHETIDLDALTLDEARLLKLFREVHDLTSALAKDWAKLEMHVRFGVGHAAKSFTECHLANLKVIRQNTPTIVSALRARNMSGLLVQNLPDGSNHEVEPDSRLLILPSHCGDSEQDQLSRILRTINSHEPKAS